METKATPNPDHGCLGKALIHEPMFILLGRDESAPGAIKRWAKSRRKFRPDEEDQTAQAEQDAIEFAKWREEHDGEWRDPDAPRGSILIPSDEISSIAGRVLSPGGSLGEIKGLTAKELETAEPDALFVSKDYADELLGLAHRLAGFVLNADPQAGPNG